MKYWIIGGISVVVLGTATFFGLNYYEQENNCTFVFTQGAPYISCDRKYFFGRHFIDKPLIERHFIDKPLILLYPPKDMSVEVYLDYSPGFSATFPHYENDIHGWSVIASPDGTLHDRYTGYETYGLFWEGNPMKKEWDISQGFVIRGSEIRAFLYEKLTDIGLNTKEKSDFIMYWYPRLQGYPYVQITFAGDEYTDIAKLQITPKPDTLLRVFMLAKPLDEFREIPAQKIEKFERKGFSVVEWGGTIIE